MTAECRISERCSERPKRNPIATCSDQEPEHDQSAPRRYQDNQDERARTRPYKAHNRILFCQPRRPACDELGPDLSPVPTLGWTAFPRETAVRPEQTDLVAKAIAGEYVASRLMSARCRQIARVLGDIGEDGGLETVYPVQAEKIDVWTRHRAHRRRSGLARSMRQSII